MSYSKPRALSTPVKAYRPLATSRRGKSFEQRYVIGRNGAAVVHSFGFRRNVRG